MDENENKAAGHGGNELEARIVAWISGEASAFEIAELERLMQEKPELAIFKRRIEAVRDLVAEAVRPEKEPLKLSGEARERLLKTIGVPAAGAPVEPKKEEEPVLAVYGRRQRVMHRWMMAAAACLGCALLFVAFLTPAFQKQRAYRAKRIEAFDAPVERKGESADLEHEDVENEKALSTATEAKEEHRRERSPLSKAAIAQGGRLYAPRPESSSASLADTGVRAPQSPAPSEAGPSQEGQNAAAPEALPSSVSPAETSAAANEPARQSVGGLNELSLDRADVGSGGQGQQSRNANGEASAPLQNNAATDGASSDQAPASPPFVVTSDEDKESDKANNTLAGARARTDLKDVSSEITVVTAQFLQDIGAKKQEDLLTFTPDTDAGPAGTVSPGSGTNPTLFGVGSPAGLFAKQPDKTAPAARAAGPSGAAAGLPVIVVNQNTGRKVDLIIGAEDDASRRPVSTFSLRVGDVSFRLAADALARGQMPDPSQIRPEEFYNALDYGDPMPALSELISCRIEQAADPLRQQRNLVRIAMRVPAAGHAAGQPLRLTVLLDTSGSMEREDRANGVHKAMEVLASLLGANDRVTLIGFARQPRLIAESLPGDQAGRLPDLASRTPPEGGTNLEEALKLGGELARRQHLDGAQNRIVVLTDGATNLGNADPGRLAATVDSLRQEGIAFDACGIGIDGVNDEVLEALTRKGGGRYYLITTPESADAGFARQLAGALRPAAENVKVQVRFNPARVGHYRLIGFEKNRLQEQDFRNDKVGAAALAAGEDAVAVYEVEPLPQGEGELGEVYVRFRAPASGSMVERSWTLPYEAYAPSFDRAAPTLQLAGTAAFVAEKLQDAPNGGGIRLAPLVPVVNALRGRYANEARVQALVSMFEQLRRLEKD